VPSAPAALDLVFARALAKNPDLRYPNARALGEAFRTALALPDSEGWRAQAELSRVAKTLSMAMVQLEGAAAPALAPTADEVPALAPEPRADASTAALAAHSPAVAAAQAEAERYATNVMTAFRKGGG
jgi:hypothetical protein